MAELIEVKALKDQKIYLKYSNGLEGIYSLAKVMQKEEYKFLNDEKVFKKVTVDKKTNDVTWGNGVLLCKNAIYKQLELMQLAEKLKLNI